MYTVVFLNGSVFYLRTYVHTYVHYVLCSLDIITFVCYVRTSVKSKFIQDARTYICTYVHTYICIFIYFIVGHPHVHTYTFVCKYEFILLYSGPQYVVDISDRSSLSTRTIAEDVTSEEESMSSPPHSETQATPSGQTSLETSVTSPSTPISPSHPVQTVEGQLDTLSIGDMDSHFTETPSLTTTDSTVDRNSRGSPAEVPPLSIGEVENSFQNMTEALDRSEGEPQHNSTLLSESQVNSSAPSKPRKDDSIEELSDSTCSTPSTGDTSLTSSVDSSCTDTPSQQSVSDNDNSDSPPHMNGTGGTSDSPPHMNGTGGTSDSPPHMNGTGGTSDSPPHMNSTGGTSDTPPHTNDTTGNNTHSPQMKDTGDHGGNQPQIDEVSDPDVVKQLQFPFQVDPSKAYQQPSLSTHHSTVENQLDDAANSKNYVFVWKFMYVRTLSSLSSPEETAESMCLTTQCLNVYDI